MASPYPLRHNPVFHAAARTTCLACLDGPLDLRHLPICSPTTLCTRSSMHHLLGMPGLSSRAV